MTNTEYLLDWLRDLADAFSDSKKTHANLKDVLELIEQLLSENKQMKQQIDYLQGYCFIVERERDGLTARVKLLEVMTLYD